MHLPNLPGLTMQLHVAMHVTVVHEEVQDTSDGQQMHDWHACGLRLTLDS